MEAFEVLLKDLAVLICHLACLCHLGAVSLASNTNTETRARHERAPDSAARHIDVISWG